MVLEDQNFNYDYNHYNAALDSASSLNEAHNECRQIDDANNNSNNKLRRDEYRDDAHLISFKMPYQQSFKATNWSQLAESTLPLRASALMMRGNGGQMASSYGGLNHHHQHGDFNKGASGNSLPYELRPIDDELFHGSVERRSKEISRKLIYVNLVSLLINLLLAIVALYFSFVSDSSSTTAFAADCILDFISSAIVLWRYYGDLNDVYMQAREQIACIYLGALFEISALGIIIKASCDIISGPGAAADDEPGYDLLYLASAAVIACSVLIAFKWSLYTTIRDKSILLDVINTVISTFFALTLCLMTVLSNFDSSFWYFDPILSIVLALFMAGFGLKVIHQNFHILHPSRHGSSSLSSSSFEKLSLNSTKNDGLSSPLTSNEQQGGHYGTNVCGQTNWQKTNLTMIDFV